SLSASARADAGPLGSALAQARAWPVPGGRAALAAKGSLASKGRTLSLDVSGIGGRSGWESGLSGRLLDPKGPVRSATLDGCRLSLGFGKKRLRVERGALGCAWSLTPKPFGPHAPKILKGRVDARGALARGRDLDSAIDATIEPAGDWYRFGGKLTAKAAGPLGGLRLSHQADLTIEIPKFERFVEYFSSSTFAVPAPLNSMRGPASLRVSGSGDGRSDPQRFELSGKTALGDGSQSLTTRVSGEVLARKLWTPERSFEASIRWDLLDVALQLPYLELQAPPRVAIDSRIKPGRMPADDEDLRMAPAPKPRPFPLALQLRVRTPDKPVRLHTNLLKDPVPLRLDVDRDKVGVSAAAARTEPFEVELFRRKALVEKFELRQSSGSNAGSVNASILYRARDSKIRILLLGSTAKPRVKFESDPPMDRSQILGLLLFGKEPSELGSDEAASVGHTNAALAEQAFGLASLFVFASTPIDYVGYNPDSQSYVVRFRLPGGATAELGSDMEETRRLRVHKRLAKNWALETELRRDSATERNAVTTFLEWFRRY
ncbi:MAG: translocation/assembly module TamB domain-containing protein, partial [Elusimicrobia bacterium]|nr:translocation/assembly module TamB domain-containing protein [Elusimicrobiota bacterium]